ncbi:VOC family protein [Bacillus alkalicellulosilyticus]|uniref:VOC family protein n=1 Tax=Alkalihalobacterium alkalicellulosilyticum TaxID=1912214 RepID=UPI0009972043|nr:VOC family protein [Bacillus alkalicellulosilyticus]
MKIVKKEIVGIMHYVKNLEYASQWYCENLGFSVGNYDFNDFVELTVYGQYVMHLFKSVDSPPAEKAYFVLSTENIESTYRMLSEKNVDLQPLQQYDDHAEFTFKDCDGNVLMICQYYK